MERFQAAPQAGVTLVELLAVFVLIGTISFTVVSNLRELENPLANAAYNIGHYLRLARSRAISQTLAIEVRPASTTRLVASSAASCDDAMTPLARLDLELEDGVHVTDLDWRVCFTQRGLADEHVTFQFEKDGQVRTVEVALGGGVRIQ